MSRPSIIEEKGPTIVRALREGNYKSTACRAAGITYTCLKQWFKRGRSGEEPYAAFLADCVAAEAESESHLVGVIRDAANKTWAAAGWLLERKFPKRWAKPETKLAIPATTDARPISNDELEAILEPIIQRRVEERLAAKAEGASQ